MTREEIKNIVRHVFHFYEVNAENCNWTDMNDACGEIFKALEQEPFINKPCVSSEVCEHDKNVVLDEIRAEIESYKLSEDELSDMDEDSVKWGMKIGYDIVDKYRAETEA